jgi:hypothetical protein
VEIVLDDDPPASIATTMMSEPETAPVGAVTVVLVRVALATDVDDRSEIVTSAP